MKPLFTRLFVLLAFAPVFLLPSCFKDSKSKTYTIYKPVYRSVVEVRSAIKSDAPQPVAKPGKLFIYGKYIFLNEIDKGVHVIDNTDPAAPVNKAFIAIPGNLDLAVKGNILYADLYRDLVTIDISNPTAITVKKITEKVFPARSYLNGFFPDSNQVIVDWITKDTTVSVDNNSFVADPRVLFAAPVAGNSAAMASTPTGISGSMARFTLVNDYLYTVTTSALNVFNVTQAENPVLTNKVPVGWQIETLFPFKNNLFIGSQTGVFIYNISNPTQPTQSSRFLHATVCDPVIADDNYAFVTLRSGNICAGSTNQLDILNINNLPSTTLVKTYPLTNPHGLSKSGNLLFICDGSAGLKVYDATDVTALKLLQTIGGLSAYDVISYNNLAIVVGTDGVYQYNYTDPKNVKLLSKISYQKS